MDNKVSCRKCIKCGFINNSSNEKCANCSSDLDKIEIKFFEGFPKQYVQVCPACKQSNYTSEKDSPVIRCFYCQRSRIRTVLPVEYIKNLQDNEAINERKSAQTKSPKESFTDKIKQEKAAIQNIQKNHENYSQCKQEESKGDIGWENILDEKAKTKQIHLTAKAYGELSFSITPDDGKYMLGRSAKHGDFLSQDMRIGNEHCYLFYKDGDWFVKDNNSKNGTFVDSRDIGINGVQVLKNGSELKLGHNDNSVAFKISIE